MNRLNAMEYFVHVVEEGSFAGAARRHNVSPQQMTRAVAELEEHLGARLINRTTRRIALTDQGERYLDRVRQILAEVLEAESQANAATSEPRGKIRVLLPPAFAAHQLAKHLPEFRRRYPQVGIELAAPGPVETVDESFDVTIIARTSPLSGDFIARPLALSEVVLCAAPGYLDQRGRPRMPGDLSAHDAIIPPIGNELYFMQGNGADAAKSERVKVAMLQPVLSTSHIDTMYAAALAGLGIAGLPSFVVADALKNKALERVLTDWRLFSIAIYAAMPTRMHIPARTRVFLDFLVETFNGEGGTIDPWLAATRATHSHGNGL